MLIYPDDEETRERAARVVAACGIIAFRTDTFYGLGADPFNAASLGDLNELKGREGKPILVLVSDLAYTERLVARKSRAFGALAARHWPGALTLVVKARREVPELLTAGTCTVGVRLPEDAEARAIVRACGGALTATSANPSGLPPARTALEVARYFPRGLGLIVDGGRARTEFPSTVLDVSGARPRLIREGVVHVRELEETLTSIGAALA